MLRVTIEYVPFGNEKHKHALDVIEVINDGKHEKRPEYGSYRAEGKMSGKTCRVSNHYRDEGMYVLFADVFARLVNNNGKDSINLGK